MKDTTLSKAFWIIVAVIIILFVAEKWQLLFSNAQDIVTFMKKGESY